MDRSPKTRFLSVRILSARGLCVALLFLKSHLLHPGKRTTKCVRLSSVVTTLFINLLWGTSTKRCADGWNYPELLTAWREERLTRGQTSLGVAGSPRETAEEFALGQAGWAFPAKSSTDMCCWLGLQEGPGCGAVSMEIPGRQLQTHPELRRGRCSARGWELLACGCTNGGSGVTEEGGGLTWNCFLSFLLQGLVFCLCLPHP